MERVSEQVNGRFVWRTPRPTLQRANGLHAHVGTLAQFFLGQSGRQSGALEQVGEWREGNAVHEAETLLNAPARHQPGT
jgi:hypothetical protein